MEHLWTALFCTVHLCVGFLAGRSSRGRPVNDRFLAPIELLPALSQFEQAYDGVQSGLGTMPEHFQVAMAELKQAAARLASELAKEKAKSQQHQDNLRSGAIAAPVADPDSSTPINEKPADEGRIAERRGYAVPEYMALCHDGVASVVEFEEVNCHDLSSSGVSFFLDRPLDRDDRIVITLGQQAGGVFMAARVAYARPVIVRGDDRYRIGCQFERRLNAAEVEMLRPLVAENVLARVR